MRFKGNKTNGSVTKRLPELTTKTVYSPLRIVITSSWDYTQIFGDLDIAQVSRI